MDGIDSGFVVIKICDQMIRKVEMELDTIMNSRLPNGKQEEYFKNLTEPCILPLTTHLSYIDFSIFVIIICFHKAFFNLRQHGVRYSLV